jgi:hypothetical protein
MSKQDDLVWACEEYANDPLGWIRLMYPWGDGVLAGWDGPDWWHIELLESLKEYLNGPVTSQPFQAAVATGHGTGKTALSAWLIQWFMACRQHPQIICTANTENQLLKKTWRELAKWHELSLCRDWFEWTATQYYLKGKAGTWFANAVTWSENNSQAFAGTHEQAGTMVLFDEASEVGDKIWEVTDGAMTTPYALWLCFGNPTRNVGRFYECFGKRRAVNGVGWRTWQIDARRCKASTLNGTEYLDRMIKEYGGVESDQAKIRVLGQFPDKSRQQLIGKEAVERAMGTTVEAWEFSPKLMGVDVARYGDNESQICIRQGRKIFPIITIPRGDLMQTASFVASTIRAEKPAVVCVDGVGMGAAVVDRLRQLNFSVVDVNGGNKPNNPRFLNKRAEMFWDLKEWLELGECELPRDEQLKEHLLSVGWEPTEASGKVKLVSKEELGVSPDKADAIAYTFAYPVYDAAEAEDVDPVLFEDS